MGGGRCRVQKRRHREILEFGQVVNQLRPEGCCRQNRGRSLADKMPPTASVVSTVHDELIVECASDTAEEIKALVETVMLDAVQTMFPGVRFEVESGICDSWAEK